MNYVNVNIKITNFEREIFTNFGEILMLIFLIVQYFEFCL